MQVKPEQNEERLRPVVDELCAIVDRLGNLADRMDKTEDLDGLDFARTLDETDESTEPVSSDNPYFADAIKVRNERSRLIQAWNNLESERRRAALESPAKNASTGVTTMISAQVKETSNENNISNDTQFLLLQRECSRKYDSQSFES